MTTWRGSATMAPRSRTTPAATCGSAPASPIRRAMLDRRVNLGIGTDGASCSDNQNMYEAMRLASFVSKVQGPEWRRWLTTREAALAATEGSARALGLRRPHRPDRAGLEGRSRDARPRPPELAAAQRPGQPAGPYRGRHRGRQRHDRRPHGRREPPRADRRSGAAARARRGGARPSRRRSTPTTAACTRRWSRSSAAIARASPPRPITSTATARVSGNTAATAARDPVRCPLPNLIVIPAKAGIRRPGSTGHSHVGRNVGPGRSLSPDQVRAGSRAGHRPDPWTGTTTGAVFDNRNEGLLTKSITYYLHTPYATRLSLRSVSNA